MSESRFLALEEKVVEPTSRVFQYALHFSLHLTLISLFESIFVWTFISPSEDAALVAVVNGYMRGVLSTCAILTNQERAALRDLVDIFINQSRVDRIGDIALASRTALNDALFRKSWYYFGGLCSVFTCLVYFGKRYTTDWRSLTLENLALVSLLGLYEWMFFSTVVLRYQAISMLELNRLVVDEFQDQC